MSDLEAEMANRLRTVLHEETVDTETVEPQFAHMLGITDLGNVHDPTNEDGTILDPSHLFWEEYEEPVKTKNKVNWKIEEALHGLRKDGILRVESVDDSTLYVEVDEI